MLFEGTSFLGSINERKKLPLVVMTEAAPYQYVFDIFVEISFSMVYR
jgi:hypothetical protein